MLQTPLPGQTFLVYTDASDVGFGAVLAQASPRGEQHMFYLSSKLTKAEKNDVAFEKETLAMKWALDGFRYCLWRQAFTIITNQAPLQCLHQMKDHNPHLTQWCLALNLLASQCRIGRAACILMQILASPPPPPAGRERLFG